MDNIGRSQVLSTSEWVIPGCPASYDFKENLENLVLFNVIYKSNRKLHTGTCMGKEKRATSNRELIVVDKCTHRL